MQLQNGVLTRGDLESYRVKEHMAIRSKYKGYTLISMPPPSSGGVHTQILNIIENDALLAYGSNSKEVIHILAEAMKRAYADRAKYLGDPLFYNVPIKALISRYAAKLRKSIDIKKATPFKDLSKIDPVPYESPSTTHISIVGQWEQCDQYNSNY